MNAGARSFPRIALHSPVPPRRLPLDPCEGVEGVISRDLQQRHFTLELRFSKIVQAVV